MIFLILVVVVDDNGMITMTTIIIQENIIINVNVGGVRGECKLLQTFPVFCMIFRNQCS